MTSGSGPLVSILCITYNQQKYIQQTVEGFLLQKDISFEVLIHDDCSTDGTRDLIEQYAKKYPKLIKPFYEESNQYSNGDFRFVNNLFLAARGKYIAWCEGDDYWLDSLKLKKQVDFLDKNPDYAVCFTAARIVYEDSSEPDRISPSGGSKNDFSLKRLLRDNYIHTCTVMYRARDDYDSLADSILPQDVYLHAFHAREGKLGFVNEVTAVYRKQAGGIWWDSRDRMSNIYRKHRFQLTNLFAVLLDMFKHEPRYQHIINRHINYLLDSFITIDKSKKTDLFVQTTRDFPELVAGYALRKYELLSEMSAEKERLQTLSNNQANEIQSIKDSKWYRLNPKVIAHRHEHESDAQ